MSLSPPAWKCSRSHGVGQGAETALGGRPEDRLRAATILIPENIIPLDEKAAAQALKLLDQIEDLDDVQKVYSNAKFPNTVLMEYATSWTWA